MSDYKPVPPRNPARVQTHQVNGSAFIKSVSPAAAYRRTSRSPAAPNPTTGMNSIQAQAAEPPLSRGAFPIEERGNGPAAPVSAHKRRTSRSPSAQKSGTGMISPIGNAGAVPRSRDAIQTNGTSHVSVAPADAYRRVRSPTPTRRTSSMDRTPISPEQPLSISRPPVPDRRMPSVERSKAWKPVNPSTFDTIQDGVEVRQTKREGVFLEAVDGVTLSTTSNNYKNTENNETMPEIEATDIGKMPVPGADEISHPEGIPWNSFEQERGRRQGARSPPPVSWNRDDNAPPRKISPHPVKPAEEVVFVDNYSRTPAVNNMHVPKPEAKVMRTLRKDDVIEHQKNFGADDSAPAPAVPGVTENDVHPGHSGSGSGSILKSIKNHLPGHHSSSSDSDSSYQPPTRSITVPGIGGDNNYYETEAITSSSGSNRASSDNNSSSGSDSGVGMVSHLGHKAGHFIGIGVPFSRRKKQVSFSATDEVRTYTPQPKRSMDAQSID